MTNILIILTLVSNLTFGQEVEKYEEHIHKDFTDYNDLILKQEFDKAMDYMLPEFFEIVPRDQMVQMMKQVFNNPEMEFKMDKPKDITYGKPEKIENAYYAAISYSYDIQMKFNNTAETDTKEQIELNRNLTVLALEKSFGTGNVKFNTETEFYEVHSKKDAFGISENGESAWKFVIVEPQQKFILEKVLPKELTEKLD